MEIQRIVIQVLVDNQVNADRLLGEAGFSALVDIYYQDEKRKQILFDTGASGKVFRHNVQELKRDLSTVDYVVLSHGHWDHVGGLKVARELIGRKVPLICHPQALVPKFREEKDHTRQLGIQDYYELDALHEDFEVIATTDPYLVSETAMTTGMIPRNNDFEFITGNLTKYQTHVEGQKVTDQLVDDLSMYFKLGDELVVLTGCCHAGIANTVAHAKDLMGTNKIAGILGGLHLHDASDERLGGTIKTLSDFEIKQVAPCHCTGIRGKVAFANTYRENYKEVSVGSILIFES